MQLQFTKYQGTGNDFILIDNRALHFNKQDPELIKHLCNRKFGIGSDGLILIENHPECDFEMIFFNPDASQSLCGNGSRCAVHFAHQLDIIRNFTEFIAVDGPHSAELHGNVVKLAMNDVKGVQVVHEDLFINTGSPHYIKWVPDITGIDVVAQGKKIRYSEPYRDKGVNVNFLKQLENSTIFVRTYERGVEDETLSCGTGVTACALAMGFKNDVNPIIVKTEGGDLKVEFEKKNMQHFTNIFLTGPVEEVFKGFINL